MHYQLDVREYRCPVPLLMARKALTNLKPKEQLTLLIAPDSSLQDFQLLCEEMQCKLLISENGRVLNVQKS